MFQNCEMKCWNVLCNTHAVKLENILFKTCLSRLCSEYFLFLLPHLVQNRMFSSGDGVASSSTSQSLLLFWQLLSSTLCRSQVTGSTAPLFGRQGFRYSSSQTCVNSASRYTLDQKWLLNALMCLWSLIQIKGTSDLSLWKSKPLYSFIGVLTWLLGGYIGHRSVFKLVKCW